MDISQAFAVTIATFNSYAHYLIEIVPVNSYQICQIICYFEPDCHFVVSISDTMCGIGNFKLAPLPNLNYLSPVNASVYKGNNKVMFDFSLLFIVFTALSCPRRDFCISHFCSALRTCTLSLPYSSIPGEIFSILDQ